MKKTLFAAVVLVAAVGGGAAYFWAGPRISMLRLRQTMKAKDTAALARRVDFDRLKTNLVPRLREVLERARAGEYPEGHPARRLARRLGPEFTASPENVEQLLDPARIRSLLGEELKHLKAAGKDVRSMLESDARFEFESSNRASVRVPVEGLGEARIVLERRGFGDWVVVDLIPPGL